ncbi:hypothetical protein GCM10023232_12950 [Sphingosinicella ginsenosidimutans]|uniref:Tryptophan-rich sensory protein n=1 Tax=Allosphingosinicella ginsenosidimutans TaxID=1176539 RepID=A0A5C6TPU4_9SPHN|nr:TspO/MBR family protein [Sphingosinicella ginsenosidimutans]TXC62393.1 tryptophan-rich sensory protein [Sphingosinicella ginsenosidimutans]
MTGIASKSQLRMSFLRYALICVPALLLLGALSAAFSGSSADNSWYMALRKPPLTPPGWVFGVVWTCLYILLGLAFAMLLHARGAHKRGRLIVLFVVGLLLNFAWSPLFFRFHEVTAALVVIAAMIVITIVLAHRLWTIRKLAAAMMLVYLAWLMFAAALNEELLRLNPGAEAVAPAASATNIPL